jgi:ectoine hydroxylase-related dioxygenase (phytanoyl-CoA dioxygenase family)
MRLHTEHWPKLSGLIELETGYDRASMIRAANLTDDIAHFQRNGYAIVANLLSEIEIAEITVALASAADSASARRRGEVYAIRNLLDLAPELRRLCDHPVIRALAEKVLGRDCFPVQATLLDKIPEANWKVPWHQDLYIPVQQRIDVDRFCGWSEKAGVIHVKPPPEILTSTLAVRVQLDACDESSGPLRVIPGSHEKGELNADDVRHWQESVNPVTCLVPRGGALLMRPLLLHASAPANSPSHRRVIHFTFATGELPGGLQWHRP